MILDWLPAKCINDPKNKRFELTILAYKHIYPRQEQEQTQSESL